MSPLKLLTQILTEPTLSPYDRVILGYLLVSGSTVTSQRQLADEVGLDTTTTERCILRLKRQGVLVKQRQAPGISCYMATDPDGWRLRARRQSPSK